MAEGLTLEQLQNKGAQPVQPPKTGGLSLGGLQGLGAKPVEKPSGLFSMDTIKGKTTYPANTETSNPIGNIGRTFGNIPSSGFKLGREVVAPVNPLDIDAPFNIGANISKMPGTVIDIFKEAGSTKGGFENIARGVHSTVNKIGAGAKDIYDQIKDTLLNDPKKAAELIAKVGVEDPLLIPTLLYGTGKGDYIKKIASPVTEKVAPAGGELLTQAGRGVREGAETTIAKNKVDFAEDLIRPVQTKKQKVSQVGQTTEKGSGIFRRNVINPTKAERAVAEEVAKIPTVSPRNTFQGNFKAIETENIRRAKDLRRLTEENDFAIPRTETISRLRQVQRDLADEATIVGDAEKTAEKLLSKVKQLIEENPGTGSGLLNVRQQFDQYVRKQKPKVFDAGAENALTIATRHIRDGLNDLFDQKANNPVLTELRRSQSRLYRALDEIRPKAAVEGNNAFARLYTRLSDSLGTRNKFVQGLLAASGLLVGGTAYAFAAPLVTAASVMAAGSFFVYKAGKLVLKPEIRKVLGDILEKAGHKLNPEDKRLIQKLLQEYNDTPNKKGGFVANPLGDLDPVGNQQKRPKKIPQNKSIITSSNNNTTKPVKVNGQTFKEIDEPTKKEMIEVIDYLRLGKDKPLNAKMESNLDKLSQKYNINSDWSNTKIADTFEKLVENTKTKSLPRVIIGQKSPQKAAERIKAEGGTVDDFIKDRLSFIKKTGYNINNVTKNRPGGRKGLTEGEKVFGPNTRRTKENSRSGNKHSTKLAAIISDSPDGFTLRLNGKPVEEGFAMSPYKDKEMIIDNLNAKSIDEYLKKHGDTLNEDGHYLGGWKNSEDGKFYLDVSVVENNKLKALEQAYKNDQIAIFDLKKIEEINTLDGLTAELKSIWGIASNSTNMPRIE